MTPTVVTFGEVMIRLAPPGGERLLQAKHLELRVGGSEANVAVALAQLGHHAVHVTRLPESALGDRIALELRGLGVDLRWVTRGPERAGLNFVERGVSQRPSTVLYDRSGSAFSACGDDDFPWTAIMEAAHAFHVSGITPALSTSCVEHAVTALTEARRRGLLTSLDVNYRRKLWTPDEARPRLEALARLADLVIVNEEDAEVVFGIRPEEGDYRMGSLSREAYAEVARRLAEVYGCRFVAITLRESHSSSFNGWAGLLFEASTGRACFSRRYDIQVLDRVGSGDAFAAGLLHGLLRGMDPQGAVEFAAAAGCLKHSIEGDLLLASAAEVQRLAAGEASGRVQR